MVIPISYGITGEHRDTQKLILRDLQIGSLNLISTPAITWGNNNGIVYVGTTALLKFAEICFSWRDKSLLLGQQGPCQDSSVISHGTQLLNGTLPTIEILTPTGMAFHTLIDTGAPQTICSKIFVEQLKGLHFFLGQNEEVTVSCSEHLHATTPFQLVIHKFMR